MRSAGSRSTVAEGRSGCSSRAVGLDAAAVRLPDRARELGAAAARGRLGPRSVGGQRGQPRRQARLRPGHRLHLDLRAARLPGGAVGRRGVDGNARRHLHGARAGRARHEPPVGGAAQLRAARRGVAHLRGVRDHGRRGRADLDRDRLLRGGARSGAARLGAAAAHLRRWRLRGARGAREAQHRDRGGGADRDRRGRDARSAVA